MEAEPSGALEDVPENQLARDSFNEAIVETKSLGDARGADRVRRTEDNSDDSPLRSVELDVHSEVLEPVSANLGCVARNLLGRHGVIVGDCPRCVRGESLSHNIIIAWSSTLP